MAKSKSYKSKNWRIIIPNLTEYTDSSVEDLMSLKYKVLEKILKRQNTKAKTVQYYHVAIQKHKNGVPHLDILLIYKKSIVKTLTQYDYIYKHGDVTRYKLLNEAILNYGKKQDLEALSNLPHSNDLILELEALKSDPYYFIYSKMKEDPIHFHFETYLEKNNLSQHINSYFTIKTKLKDMQVAAANLLLSEKAGIKLITRELIVQNLSPEQLEIYDSWSGYQTIVDYLNEMVLLKGDRDPKTKNLLLTGAPNTGKSALLWHPKPHGKFNPLSKYCSVYPIGMSQWFPKYHSEVYHLIYWNEARLTAYSYDTVLKLLDGSPLDLPNKGSVSRKVDNPLIIMTSNMTLDQMIIQKFGYNSSFAKMANKNLFVRIQNVIIPEGYDLFLLQKLFQY
jgi:hypothetical protein